MKRLSHNFSCRVDKYIKWYSQIKTQFKIGYIMHTVVVKCDDSLNCLREKCLHYVT